MFKAQRQRVGYNKRNVESQHTTTRLGGDFLPRLSTNTLDLHLLFAAF